MYWKHKTLKGIALYIQGENNVFFDFILHSQQL